jgi:ABC-type glycerol-3-phosphate transport system substrate-binding protein
MVAPMPQVKGASTKLTYAHVTGIAISSASKNFTTAFTAASFLATGDFAGKLATISGEVPVRRDLLAVKQTDAYTPIFYSSALYGSSWLDPSTTDTDNIFQNMVESVLSNNMTVDEAVRDASGKLDLLFAK